MLTKSHGFTVIYTDSAGRMPARVCFAIGRLSSERALGAEERGLEQLLSVLIRVYLLLPQKVMAIWTDRPPGTRLRLRVF
jgi:hypothetical protein